VDGPGPAGTDERVTVAPSPSLFVRGWRRVRAVPSAEWLALGILSLAVVAFSVWWTDLEWVSFLGFHQAVYDLGVDYQVIWAAAHGYSINEAGPGATHLILYLFVIPYWLIPSQSGFFLFLLAFEAVWVGLGVFPIYWVAKEQLGRRWIGLALGLAYLAYPAMSGPLWFPFHYEALFPTLFLFGYWLYRRGNLLGAGAFWVASLFTDAGVTFIIAAFGLGILAEPLIARTGIWARLRGRPRPGPVPIPRAKWMFGLFLIAAGAAVFLGVALSYGFWEFVFFTARSSFTTGSTLARVAPIDPLANWARKLATVLLLFGPLLALPLWGREERWALLPYLGPALLTTSFTGFLSPFVDQYVAFVIPVLFVATVRGLERPWGYRPASDSGPPVPHAAVRRRRLYRPVPVATTVLVVTVACAMVFTPWGPFNTEIDRPHVSIDVAYYNVPYVRYSNQTVNAALLQMIDMVPPTGWVLVQDNIPQLLNRTEWTVPGFYAVGQPLSYLITDPYDYNFYALNTFGPLPDSMMFWANYFLSQGWHVLADAYGCLLLSSTGSGPPALYQPLVLSFTPSDFLGVGPERPNHQLFNGPLLPIDGAYSVLSPGNYTVTLTLRVDHPNATDQLYFGIGYNYSANLLQNNSIPGAPWAGLNGTVALTYAISVPSYFPGGPVFTLYERQWTGPLSIVSVRMAQSAPATPPSGT
jgi:uncharacterized membrane protein